MAEKLHPLKQLKDVMVVKIAKIIADVLQDNKYDRNKLDSWCKQIIKTVHSELAANNNYQDQEFQYKYVVNAVIMERGLNTGIHSKSSCFWQRGSDISMSAKLNNETLCCICSAWAIKCTKTCD